MHFFNLVRKSGAGGEVVGDVSVGSLASSILQMTNEGQITLGSFSSVVVSGSDVGGDNRQRESLTSSYYPDGYLIAIAGSDGRVRYGFIAGDREASGFYIYLNGNQYLSRK